ncbi:MAG: hypothetical protein LIQ31_12560 [Planctomycetes bacterium]|nr:hypothetical protein [Planctomycetota bacterium]
MIVSGKGDLGHNAHLEEAALDVPAGDAPRLAPGRRRTEDGGGDLPYLVLRAVDTGDIADTDVLAGGLRLPTDYHHYFGPGRGAI